MHGIDPNRRKMLRDGSDGFLNIRVVFCEHLYFPPVLAFEETCPCIDMIANALADKPLPVYGEGLNVRDWLYVEDRCKAIDLITHVTDRTGHDMRYAIDP